MYGSTARAMISELGLGCQFTCAVNWLMRKQKTRRDLHTASAPLELLCLPYPLDWEPTKGTGFCRSGVWTRLTLLGERGVAFLSSIATLLYFVEPNLSSSRIGRLSFTWASSDHRIKMAALAYLLAPVGCQAGPPSFGIILAALQMSPSGCSQIVVVHGCIIDCWCAVFLIWSGFDCWRQVRSQVDEPEPTTATKRLSRSRSSRENRSAGCFGGRKTTAQLILFTNKAVPQMYSQCMRYYSASALCVCVQPLHTHTHTEQSREP